ADLARLLQPAAVDDRPAAGQFGAQQPGHLGGDLDLRLVADAAADTEDLVGVRQVDATLFGQDLLEDTAAQLVERRRRGQGLDAATGTGPAGRLVVAARHHGGDGGQRRGAARRELAA